MIDSLISTEALQYVQMGLPIIPLCSHNHEGMSKKHIKFCPCPGKIPLIKGWQNKIETKEEELNTWFAQFNSMNIGLPLGNSGYVGIDIDGDEGEELLIEMSQNDLPTTWEYVTGAGRRLLYHIPIGLKTQKFKNTGNGEHQECSILCKGQQTVLPPSIHYTGVRYEWVEGRSPKEIDCANAPQWLIELIKIPTKNNIKINMNKIDLSAIGMNDNNNRININKEEELQNQFKSNSSDITFENIPVTNGVEEKIIKKKQHNKKDINNLSKITTEDLTRVLNKGERDIMMTRITGYFCNKAKSLGKDHIMLLAKAHNNKYCNPPLTDEAIEIKVSKFWELEQMKNSQFKTPMQNNVQFDAHEMAKTILNVWKNEGWIINIQRQGDVIWYCKQNKGPWKSIDTHTTEFYSYFSYILTNPSYGGCSNWLNSNKIKDTSLAIVLLLRNLRYYWDENTISDHNTQSLENCKYIPLKDGKLLDWRTRKIIPWDPETKLTYYIPREYKPYAECPYWRKKLQEWLPDRNSQLLIQEFIGYSLIPYMGFEKALLILGEGANGKSIFLDTIQRMLGYEITGSNTMKNIFSTFGKEALQGKILNICNEAGGNYLRNEKADDFKNLVSGGRVVADVKYQSSKVFNNTAKFIFSANQQILTNDKSEGWKRRLIIVPFLQSFKDSTTPKYEIMRNLEKEMDGIFNWSLDGLIRLMQQQQFSVSTSAEKIKQAYIFDNDIAEEFYHSCLETFDMKIYNEEHNTSARWGTPTKLVNELFKCWVEFKESRIKRSKTYITGYLQKKHGLQKAKLTNILYSNRKQTTCWVGLRLNIQNLEFLEFLQDECYSQEIRQYTLRQMTKLNNEAS